MPPPNSSGQLACECRCSGVMTAAKSQTFEWSKDSLWKIYGSSMDSLRTHGLRMSETSSIELQTAQRVPRKFHVELVLLLDHNSWERRRNMLKHDNNRKKRQKNLRMLKSNHLHYDCLILFVVYCLCHIVCICFDLRTHILIISLPHHE